MRYFVPVVLLLVALIHALPLVGVMGASRLTQLYGVPVSDPGLELLLRHRAVLFGLLALFLAYAAACPALHRMALLAAIVSVSSFLVLAWQTSTLTPAIDTVVRVDWLALALLVLGVLVHTVRSE